MKLLQTVLVASATALSALAFSGSVANAAPLAQPDSTTACRLTEARPIAASRATSSAWKLRWEWLRSASAKSLKTTEVIAALSPTT